MCAPGPINNERLFEKDQLVLRKNLRLKLDYIGVNARVWWLFMHIHGGGPAIVREELEIYSQELSAETDLIPEELSQTGSDFAKRASRQFVDDCHGDLELHDSRYGGISDSVGAKTSEAVEIGLTASGEALDSLSQGVSEAVARMEVNDVQPLKPEL
mmetsp:Transcript_52980/g.95656  ORF Transcript_52980/g.95656 Transcript_52980/m.95656 type:complete len:157 (+) Transcript_52980:44-514(+)